MAYCPEDDEFFLVWQSEGKILGRRLASASGDPLGALIPLSIGVGAESPAVVYDAAEEGYRVTWRQAPNVNDGIEILTRQVSADGVPTGSAERISDMGPDGNPSYTAQRPSLTVGADGEYLVVWAGNDNRAHLDEAGSQIFGQLLTTEPNELFFRVKEIVIEDGDILMIFTAVPGDFYRAQASGDAQNWVDISANIVGQSGGVGGFIDETGLANHDRRFYRIRKLP